MKRLQYGCQGKLVNDFKMILLCFSISSFIQYVRFVLKDKGWLYSNVIINTEDITEIHVTQRLEALHKGDW